MLSILFFNVGHGDSIAIKFPDGQWGIIDSNRDKGEQEPNVLKFLKFNKISKLNFICVTHPHFDHYRGIKEIMCYCKQVDKLILYGLNTGCRDEADSKGNIYGAIIDFMKSKQKTSNDFIIAQKDMSYFVTDNVSLKFLSPTDSEKKDFVLKKLYLGPREEANKLSVVIQIVYAGKRILLCADAAPINWTYLEPEDISSDIVKLPHHGSKHNNTPKILNQIANLESLISIVSSDGGKLYPSIPDEKIIEFLESLKDGKVLKTYELPQKTTSEYDDDTICSDFLRAGIDNVSEVRPRILHDGAFLITIDCKGNIATQKYDNIFDIKI